MSSVVSENNFSPNENGANAVHPHEPARDVVSEIIEEAELIGENSSPLVELRKIVVHSEAVGDVLPEAVIKSAQKNNQLARATLPLIESNIRESVLRNPEILAEAIFPVIGPAIRKAVGEALSQLIQSFNETLEKSVSIKGVRWRIEAWRTGKSFGEVVLLKTLLYRVEQVFLIHKKTGILLKHASAVNAKYNDADMVSAMLTAIQDFVQDSFEKSEGAMLDALKVRDLSVWIEYSPDAILAAVIRGNAPFVLRGVLIEHLEDIQVRYEEELEDFQGSVQDFDSTLPVLQDCLRLQVSEEKKAHWKFLKPSKALATVFLLLILTGGFFYVRDYLRWSNYLTRLKNEEGIAVTEADRSIFRREIRGLRSDGAVDPETLLPEYGYSRTDVESHWKIYQDMSAEIVLERAKKILRPPPTAELTLENGILTVQGTAPNEWLLEARDLSKAIGGISGFKVVR